MAASHVYSINIDTPAGVTSHTALSLAASARLILATLEANGWDADEFGSQHSAQGQGISASTISSHIAAGGNYSLDAYQNGRPRVMIDIELKPMSPALWAAGTLLNAQLKDGTAVAAPAAAEPVGEELATEEAAEPQAADADDAHEPAAGPYIVTIKGVPARFAELSTAMDHISEAGALILSEDRQAAAEQLPAGKVLPYTFGPGKDGKALLYMELPAPAGHTDAAGNELPWPAGQAPAAQPGPGPELMSKARQLLSGPAAEELAELVGLQLATASEQQAARAAAGPKEEKGWHVPQEPVRPRIVCLCGSTRFRTAFEDANLVETLAGKIVLMPGHFTHALSSEQAFGHKEAHFGPEVAAQLDELYKRKIDLCDEVLILNVGGYLGESTRSELAYARAAGKLIRWLEPGTAPELQEWQRATLREMAEANHYTPYQLAWLTDQELIDAAGFVTFQKATAEEPAILAPTEKQELIERIYAAAPERLKFTARTGERMLWQEPGSPRLERGQWLQLKEQPLEKLQAIASRLQGLQPPLTGQLPEAIELKLRQAGFEVYTPERPLTLAQPAPEPEPLLPFTYPQK